MDTILGKILREKEKEVAELKNMPIHGSGRNPLSFKKALDSTRGVAVIAEMKRHSPSKGALNGSADPSKQAKLYEAAGACAISVLTDGPFFKGSFEDLEDVRRTVSIPVLCKDFIIDPIQIARAAAAGADAVLLIVAALSPAKLRELYISSKEQGLDILVEVHDEEELETAIRLGADIIGINNRNLRTFEVDLAHTTALAKKIPAGVTIVSESGIRTKDDVMEVNQAGAKAVLVGEALMTAVDPASALRDLTFRPKEEAQ